MSMRVTLTQEQLIRLREFSERAVGLKVDVREAGFTVKGVIEATYRVPEPKGQESCFINTKGEVLMA